MSENWPELAETVGIPIPAPDPLWVAIDNLNHAVSDWYAKEYLNDSPECQRIVRLARRLFSEKHQGVDPDQTVIGDRHMHPTVVAGKAVCLLNLRPAWSIYVRDIVDAIDIIAEKID